MPTKEECKKGVHTLDNQGLCHWCGKIVDAYALIDYYSDESIRDRENTAVHTTDAETDQ